MLLPPKDWKYRCGPSDLATFEYVKWVFDLPFEIHFIFLSQQFSNPHSGDIKTLLTYSVMFLFKAYVVILCLNSFLLEMKITCFEFLRPFLSFISSSMCESSSTFITLFPSALTGGLVHRMLLLAVLALPFPFTVIPKGEAAYVTHACSHSTVVSQKSRVRFVASPTAQYRDLYFQAPCACANV